jgi:GNAT superfamily N-acetyltransferase
MTGSDKMKMISVIKATESNSISIASIGRISVEESHRGSCSAVEMQEFLEKHYNNDVIKEELKDVVNIYHVINYNDKPVGFSKIVLNTGGPNIASENVAKLDRIYLLKEYHGLKLGLKLFEHNIALARNHHQSGMWLYTWVGNSSAIDFYLKAGFKIIGSYNFQVNENHYDLCHQMFLNFNDRVV